LEDAIEIVWVCMTREIPRPVRIDPAFDDRDGIRDLFAANGPYLAAAAYLPDGSDENEPRRPDAAFPWFRETWALGGEPLVQGVEPVLYNPRFIDAAAAAFRASRIVPKTVVVNVNAPMPAGVPHVDVPSFHGATREHFSLRLLIAMGASGLFEPWRICEAGAICWFYDGPGGSFDYWPDGFDQPMASERPPFGNVAIVADNHRMYHCIGAIGGPNPTLPKMTAAAEILRTDGGWSIREHGEIVASYSTDAVRLSVLWKAEVFGDEDEAALADPLSPARIVEILQHDLHRRRLHIDGSDDPLADAAWIAEVCRTYAIRARPVPHG